MNIFESINVAMNEIGAVGKDSKNTTQGFMFRGIDAVMNAINPAIRKAKIFISPEVLEQTREERTNAKGTTLIYSIIKVRYTFFAEDGTSVSAVVIGEGMDTGDKATNKAMSIAFKYACFQVFCIPTEEMVDPDIECHEVKKKAEEQPKKVEAPKQPEPKKEAPQPAPQNAYPPRDVMLQVARNSYPEGSKQLDALLNCWKIKRLDDATDQQLIVVWNRYGR